MPLLIGLFLFSLLEIWLLIEIGGEIGGWTTIAWVIATAIAGGLLLRRQGGAVLNRIREELTAEGRPDGAALAGDLLDGFTVLFAAVFLILPGFITDTLGIVLFVPALRRSIGRRLWGWLRGSEQVRVYAARGRTTIIEGDFREVGGEPGRSPDDGDDPDRPRLR